MLAMSYCVCRDNMSEICSPMKFRSIHIEAELDGINCAYTSVKGIGGGDHR